MDLHILLLAGLFIVVAALVQGTLGLGLSLIAAPVVAAGWLTTARVLTTPLGVLILAWLPASAIGIVVGTVVLGAIVLTTWRLEVRPTRRNLLIAGAVAGVSGTAASIGGPPAAVVLQHEHGARLRATLAAFFLIGSLVSLVALAVGGQLTHHQVVYGVAWIPALALGFGLAVPLQKRLRGPRLRQAVLLLAALSSVAVIVRSAL